VPASPVTAAALESYGREGETGVRRYIRAKATRWLLNNHDPHTIHHTRSCENCTVRSTSGDIVFGTAREGVSIRRSAFGVVAYGARRSVL
jgi:hypothetical protein